nr:hypothetical protein BaRGS_025998 [Batillaria attramentaria]
MVVVGGAVVDFCAKLKVDNVKDMSGVKKLPGYSTPTYCPVLTHSGHLMFGIGDMDVHSVVSPEMDKAATLKYYPATPPGGEPVSVVNVSGAGDCLNAAMMHFIIQGHDLDLSVKAGLLAAQHSLQADSAVPASITPEMFTVERVLDWARFEATDLSHVL